MSSFLHAINFKFFKHRSSNLIKNGEFFLFFQTNSNSNLPNWDKIRPISTKPLQIWLQQSNRMLDNFGNETRSNKMESFIKNLYQINQFSPKWQEEKIKIDWKRVLTLCVPTTDQRKLLVKESGLGRKNFSSLRFSISSSSSQVESIGLPIQGQSKFGNPFLATTHFLATHGLIFDSIGTNVQLIKWMPAAPYFPCHNFWTASPTRLCFFSRSRTHQDLCSTLGQHVWQV